MKYQIDSQYLLDCFRRIVETPSPVGFYSLLNPVLEQEAALHGEGVTYDNKSTPYITLEGQDNSKTVLVGAHSDTIGLIIRKIDANGWIRVRQMGGMPLIPKPADLAAVVSERESLLRRRAEALWTLALPCPMAGGAMVRERPYLDEA